MAHRDVDFKTFVHLATYLTAAALSTHCPSRRARLSRSTHPVWQPSCSRRCACHRPIPATTPRDRPTARSCASVLKTRDPHLPDATRRVYDIDHALSPRPVTDEDVMPGPRPSLRGLSLPRKSRPLPRPSTRNCSPCGLAVHMCLLLAYVLCRPRSATILSPPSSSAWPGRLSKSRLMGSSTRSMCPTSNTLFQSSSARI